MLIRCPRLEGLHLSTIPMVHMDSSKLVVNMGVAEVVQAVAVASLVRLVVATHLVVAVLDTLVRLVARLVVALDTLVAKTLVALDTLVVACQTQVLVVASHLVVVDIMGSSLDSQAALVVVAEDPEVGVALGGAGRPQGKSFATGVVRLATSLPIAQMLQPMW